ncbi:MAG: hypothetical protein ABIX01_00100 [Chitinophagaceae bacterium]
MKKKSWLIYGPLLLLILFVVVSCKKQSRSDLQPKNSDIEDAKLWFEANIIKTEKEMLATPFSVLPETSEKRIFARMQKVGKNLQWNEAQVHSFNEINYVTVPVDEPIKPFSKKSFQAQRSFVFYKNKLGIFQMNVVEIIGDREKSLNCDAEEVTNLAFRNMYWDKAEPLKNFNGSIIFYDAEYKPVSSYRVSNGLWNTAKIDVKNIKSPSNPSQNLANPDDEPGCVTWYTVGFWYDLNTGQIVDWEILDVVTICPTSGGGGYGEGGSSTDPECVSTTVSNAENLSNTTESSETIGFNIYDIPDNGFYTPKAKKAKNPIWKCITSYGGWSLLSHEDGIIELQQKGATAAEDVWYWASLSHNSIEMLGITIGGSVEPSNGVGTPHVYTLYAAMELDFSVKYIVNPLSCPYIPVLPPYTRSYHSTSTFWDSKPY